MTDREILIWYEGLEAATCNTNEPEKMIVACVREFIQEHVRSAVAEMREKSKGLLDEPYKVAQLERANEELAGNIVKKARAEGEMSGLNIARSAVFDLFMDDPDPHWLEKRLEMKDRYWMWVSHGHEGLYGDDGEMQCGLCHLDYKRAPFETVQATYLRLHAQHRNRNRLV